MWAVIDRPFQGTRIHSPCALTDRPERKPDAGLGNPRVIPLRFTVLNEKWPRSCPAVSIFTMTRSVSTIILAALFFLGATPGKLQTFKDWTIGCDNILTCEAQSLTPDGLHEIKV